MKNDAPSQLQRVFLIGGWILGAVASLATLSLLAGVLGRYDEGILLSDSEALLRGAVPFRDFYSNYPPGMFDLLSSIWRLTGESILSARLVGLALHFAIAVLVGRLSARVAGERFLPLPAAVILGFLLVTGPAPYHYLAAVALALGFCELALDAIERGVTPLRCVLAGLVLGAISTFRHDVFVYVCVGAVGLAVVAIWKRRLRITPEMLKSFAFIVLGVVVIVVPFWTRVFAGAGLTRVALDLYFDQVRLVLPARVTPFPKMLPNVLFDAYPIAVVSVLTAPLVAFFGWLKIEDAAARRVVLAIGVLSIALIPQSVGRADIHHLAYGLSPAIILAGGALHRLAGRAAHPWLAALPVLWWITALLPIQFDAFRGLGRGVSSIPLDHEESRRAAIAFIDAHTSPEEPIYVGVHDHRRLIIDDVDLYFLSHRSAATRRAQFDPNVVTRAEFQREMIADLERRRPKVAVLADDCYWDEPNLSRVEGDSLLDEYLAAHYEETGSAEPFHFLVRKGD